MGNGVHLDQTLVFQSHAGSIEVESSSAWTSGIPDFNPTLVRLRPSPIPGPPGKERDFNPTLVRLRLLQEGHPGAPVSPFQSHAGSIEAVFSLYNSTHGGVFQSHAGSIEAVAVSPGVVNLSFHFNPTLVRLRP